MKGSEIDYGEFEVKWFAHAQKCIDACAGINPEAVPDLLAAAKMIVRLYMPEELLFAKDKLKTAIAKAEGLKP